MKKYLPIVKKTLPAVLLILSACSQTSAGNHIPQTVDTKTAQNITQQLEAAYQSQGLKVNEVNATPIEGIYEVLLPGKQIIYVDKDAKHMIVGDLLDIAAKKNLTEERLAKLNVIDYDKLPFDKAIKEVRGAGQRSIAVFSDPDCPFCRRLENEFAKMDNITIYTFLMPIPQLHPRAQKRAENIWCSSDRLQAWTTWMREGVEPKSSASCANPVAEIMQLGNRHGFNGTPTLVFPNGQVTAGYLPKEALEKALDENQK